jgi:hypothetical protein
MQFPQSPVMPIAFGGAALVVLATVITDSVVQRRTEMGPACNGASETRHSSRP